MFKVGEKILVNIPKSKDTQGDLTQSSWHGYPEIFVNNTLTVTQVDDHIFVKVAVPWSEYGWWVPRVHCSKGQGEPTCSIFIQ